MKIGVSATYLFDEASSRNAGISRYSRRILEALFALPGDDRYVVFTNDGFRPPEAWTALPHVEVHPIVPDRRGKRGLWEAFGATREIRTRGIDVWFSTANTVPFGARIPTVTMLHDMFPLVHPEFQDWKQSMYMRWAIRSAARRSDRIVAHCEASKAEIARLTGAPLSKISVALLGPGNVIAPADPFTVKVDVPFERFFFTLGTLEPRKNIPMLFEALARLEDKEVGLVIAGGRGWKEAGIFETLDRLGVKDRVHFAGYVPDEDLPALFAKCEAFVYPTLMEGFGLPVLEGMLAGAPVLTSTDPAVREVGGDVARYFDPRDPDDIARALAEGFPDRAETIRRGLARGAEFTWERCARATRGAMEDAAKGKKLS